MISDATHLQMIKAVGGVRVSSDAGSFWAVFDYEYLEALDTETRTPVLTSCRTADVERLQIRKGSALQVAGSNYSVRRHEPDGTGMSRVVLES